MSADLVTVDPPDTQNLEPEGFNETEILRDRDDNVIGSRRLRYSLRDLDAEVEAAYDRGFKAGAEREAADVARRLERAARDGAEATARDLNERIERGELVLMSRDKFKAAVVQATEGAWRDGWRKAVGRCHKSNETASTSPSRCRLRRTST